MKDNLLDFCRYYGHNVDEEEPNVQMFVRCEEYWIYSMNNAKDNSDIISEYLRAGLNEFERLDETPILLKAILFNRFIHYNERVDVEGFKDFYLNEYIGLSEKTT